MLRVWLTGASGMLGRAMRERLTQLGIETTGTDIEIDIGDQNAVRKFLEARKFTHIINCAAYTQVDRAETDSAAAFAANAVGPANLGLVALQAGTTLLHFSTDYVFDGEATVLYSEEDACAPRNVYGRSKLEGERNLLALANDPWPLYIVRTSWLFGAGRSSFVSTVLRLLSERESLRIVDDQHGRPTYAKDLAETSLALVGLDPSSRTAAPGIYHFANRGSTTWHGFACRIFALCGELGIPVKTRELVPISTEEYPLPAPRPMRSVLATDKIERALNLRPRHWEDALREHLISVARKSS